MRVLLTGAGGFIGSEIARQLRARGDVVAGMMRRADQCVAAEDFAADFLRPETYREALARFRPDALIHAGWFGVAPRERDLPTQLDNVPALGALVVAAIGAGACVTIGLGTQAEYGLTRDVIDEEAPARPVTLYGMAKCAAGGALLRIAHGHGARGVWARIFGVYGPGETAPSMLPWFAREVASGRAPQLTACTQLWDFLHVRDVAGAVVALLDSKAAGVFNIASGHAPPLRDTVLMLRDMIDPAIAPAFGAVPFGAGQIMCLGGRNDRLVAATGWRPKVALEDGLREVADEGRRAARVI